MERNEDEVVEEGSEEGSDEYLSDDDGSSKGSVVGVMTQNGGASGTIFISDHSQQGDFSLLDDNLDDNTFSSSPGASGGDTGGRVPPAPGIEVRHSTAAAAQSSRRERKDAKAHHKKTVSTSRGRNSGSGSDSEEDAHHYGPSEGDQDAVNVQLMKQLEEARDRERETATTAEITSLKQQLELALLREQLAQMVAGIPGAPGASAPSGRLSAGRRSIAQERANNVAANYQNESVTYWGEQVESVPGKYQLVAGTGMIPLSNAPAVPFDINFSAPKMLEWMHKWHLKIKNENENWVTVNMLKNSRWRALARSYDVDISGLDDTEDFPSRRVNELFAAIFRKCFPSALHEAAKDERPALPSLAFNSDAANKLVQVNAFILAFKEDAQVRGIRSGQATKEYLCSITKGVKDPKDASKYVIEEDRYFKDPKLREDLAKFASNCESLKEFEAELMDKWRAMEHASDQFAKVFCVKGQPVSKVIEKLRSKEESASKTQEDAKPAGGKDGGRVRDQPGEDRKCGKCKRAYHGKEANCKATTFLDRNGSERPFQAEPTRCVHFRTPEGCYDCNKDKPGVEKCDHTDQYGYMKSKCFACKKSPSGGGASAAAAAQPKQTFADAASKSAAAKTSGGGGGSVGGGGASKIASVNLIMPARSMPHKISNSTFQKQQTSELELDERPFDGDGPSCDGIIFRAVIEIDGVLYLVRAMHDNGTLGALYLLNSKYIPDDIYSTWNSSPVTYGIGDCYPSQDAWRPCPGGELACGDNVRMEMQGEVEFKIMALASFAGGVFWSGGTPWSDLVSRAINISGLELPAGAETGFIPPGAQPHDPKEFYMVTEKGYLRPTRDMKRPGILTAVDFGLLENAPQFIIGQAATLLESSQMLSGIHQLVESVRAPRSLTCSRGDQDIRRSRADFLHELRTEVEFEQNKPDRLRDREAAVVLVSEGSGNEVEEHIQGQLGANDEPSAPCERSEQAGQNQALAAAAPTQQPAELVTGTVFYKRFKDVFFRGKIVGMPTMVRKKGRRSKGLVQVYPVVYDDGDKEDLTWAEINDCMVEYAAHLLEERLEEPMPPLQQERIKQHCTLGGNCCLSQDLIDFFLNVVKVHADKSLSHPSGRSLYRFMLRKYPEECIKFKLTRYMCEQLPLFCPWCQLRSIHRSHRLDIGGNTGFDFPEEVDDLPGAVTIMDNVAMPISGKHPFKGMTIGVDGKFGGISITPVTDDGQFETMRAICLHQQLTGSPSTEIYLVARGGSQERAFKSDGGSNFTGELCENFRKMLGYGISIKSVPGDKQKGAGVQENAVGRAVRMVQVVAHVFQKIFGESHNDLWPLAAALAQINLNNLESYDGQRPPPSALLNPIGSEAGKVVLQRCRETLKRGDYEELLGKLYDLQIETLDLFLAAREKEFGGGQQAAKVAATAVPPGTLVKLQRSDMDFSKRGGTQDRLKSNCMGPLQVVSDEGEYLVVRDLVEGNEHKVIKRRFAIFNYDSRITPSSPQEIAAAMDGSFLITEVMRHEGTTATTARFLLRHAGFEDDDRWYPWVSVRNNAVVNAYVENTRGLSRLRQKKKAVVNIISQKPKFEKDWSKVDGDLMPGDVFKWRQSTEEFAGSELMQDETHDLTTAAEDDVAWKKVKFDPQGIATKAQTERFWRITEAAKSVFFKPGKEPVRMAPLKFRLQPQVDVTKASLSSLQCTDRPFREYPTHAFYAERHFEEKIAQGSLVPAENRGIVSSINMVAEPRNQSKAEAKYAFMFGGDVSKVPPFQRFCIDQRNVNKSALSPANAPIRSMGDIQRLFAGSGVGSKIDASDMFGQFEVAPEHQIFSTIRVPYSLRHKFPHAFYKSTRLPMGCSQSVELAQIAAEQILDSMLCILDDHAFFDGAPDDIPGSVDACLDSWEKKLQRCIDFNYKLSAPKCEICCLEMKLLGLICSSTKLRLTDEFIAEVASWECPNTVREVMSFVGLVNWAREFNPEHADCCSVMRDEYKGHESDLKYKFVPSTRCIQAFEKLKSMLANPFSLYQFDPSKRLFCTADASGDGKFKGGYAFMFFQLEDDTVVVDPKNLGQLKKQLIIFGSHAFKGPELNYPTVEQEALALFKAITDNRHLCFGRHFTLFTDHRNLTFLLQSESRKLIRWRAVLQDFNFDVVHVPGLQNWESDYLSRLERRR